jgi:hypothetical protein
MTARLELVWPVKDKFLLVHEDEQSKPVWVEREHPAASEVRLTDATGTVGDVPEDPYPRTSSSPATAGAYLSHHTRSRGDQHPPQASRIMIGTAEGSVDT